MTLNIAAITTGTQVAFSTAPDADWYEVLDVAQEYLLVFATNDPSMTPRHCDTFFVKQLRNI